MGFAEQKRKSTTRNIKVVKGKISLVEENIQIVDETLIMLLWKLKGKSSKIIYINDK